VKITLKRQYTFTLGDKSLTLPPGVHPAVPNWVAATPEYLQGIQTERIFLNTK
jgi:hypothetical protein